jgi:lauroyl/myristoyl acyltransferase
MTKTPRVAAGGEPFKLLTTGHLLVRLLKSVAGILFIRLLPRKTTSKVFEYFAYRKDETPEDRVRHEKLIEDMQSLLGQRYTKVELRSFAKEVDDRRREDMWGRWQAICDADWDVRTEVAGLEHVDQALQDGNGAVFWGMSFCGTFYSKVALARAGVALAQLSTVDHGISNPLALIDEKALGPLHCLAEDRYLTERIRISEDGSNNYLFRIGEVLRDNRCIWIAGERDRGTKFIAAEVFGRHALFPAGAPMLALRNKATLLSAYTERLGPLHYKVTVEPAFSRKAGARPKEFISQAVEEYAKRLEDQIIAHPADLDWNYSWAERLVENSF